MKKKKLSLIGVIILAALYLLFGLGPDVPPAAEPALPTETITATIQEIYETVTEPTTAESKDATDPYSGETEAPVPNETEAPPPETTEAELWLDPDGSYTTKDDVALYIYLYGELPKNFITKNEARDLGWSGGGLDKYAPGMCIGGDRFGNYEGLLPDAKGRRWTECDIDTLGAKSRGAKRIVFSNDGLIYYTDDHYESFELLYGEE